MLKFKFLFICIFLQIITFTLFCNQNDDSNNISEIKIQSKASGDLYINNKFIKKMDAYEIYFSNNFIEDSTNDIDFVYNYSILKKKLNYETINYRIEKSKNYFFQFNTTEKEIYQKYWRKHFFDILVGAGPSYTLVRGYKNDYDFENGIESEYDFKYTTISLSFSYVYAFSKIFGFGGGLSGNLTVPVFILSGGSILLSFMIGSLYKHKIAFLFDIGGGGLMTYKLGIYVKGFVFKFSHNLGVLSFTTISGVHNFSFEFGYKINWSRKYRNTNQIITISGT